ncbi:uncharacterized protein BN642_00507 [Collinsella sp. CAG:398]|nr:uncharacterized protein BN642_00507 [Collinsella sp. CAG:398]
MLHGARTLGDDDLGGLGQVARQAFADERIGLGVHGAGGIVQDQHLGVLQQRAGDAQALLLAARHVRAALLDIGVVLLREGLDELIGLGELAHLDELVVRGVRVAPAQVLLDGAAEEHVLLQHHGHVVAQELQIIVAHVDAAHLHGALGHVVQAADEVHERGFGRTGAAHDAQGLAALDVQVDLGEGAVLRLLGVVERDVVEVDRAVLHLGDGVGRVLDGGLGLDDLDDTLGALLRHDDHGEDHRYHHEGHEDHEAIGGERAELAHVEEGAAARDDEVAAELDDHDEHRVDGEVHHGGVEREDLLGAGEVAADILRGAAELLLFKVLAHVALHIAHAGDVFLDGLVQGIVLMEHRAENGVHRAHDFIQTEAEQGHDDHEHRGHGARHDEGHDDAADEQERAANGGADDHHVG